MKSNLLILIRSNFQMLLGSLRNSKRFGKYLASGMAVALLYLAFSVLMGFNAYTVIQQMQLSGTPGYAIYNQVSTAMLFAILIAVMKSGTSATSKDADFMLSLPISRATIILSKTVALYLMDLAMVAAILLPSLAVYTYLVDLSAGFLLRGLLVMLLIPLLSNSIAQLLSYLLLKISGRMAKPELLRSALILVFVVLFLISYYAMTGQTFSNNGSSVAGFTSDRNPLIWGAVFALTGSLKHLLLLLAVTVVPFIAGTLLQASVYGAKPTVYHSGNKTLDFTQHTPLRSLFLKETRFYFSIPIYVVNTIIGPIFAVVIAVALAIYHSFITTLFPVGVSIILFSVFVFCITLSCISASSISLEGKNIRILRASPLDEKTIFLAKIATQLVIVAPVTVLGAVVSGIFLQLPVAELLLVALCCILLNFVAAVFGLLINLAFPKLDWQSEVIVVKQSMAAMICVFSGMFLSAIPALLFFLAIPNAVVVLALFAALLSAVLAVCWIVLMRTGRRSFRAL